MTVKRSSQKRIRVSYSIFVNEMCSQGIVDVGDSIFRHDTILLFYSFSMFSFFFGGRERLEDIG